jgi:hypothetical protein
VIRKFVKRDLGCQAGSDPPSEEGVNLGDLGTKKATHPFTMKL